MGDASAGGGNVFVEMLITGNLDREWDDYKTKHADLFTGSDHRPLKLDVYGAAVCALQPGPLSLGRTESPEGSSEPGESLAAELAEGVQERRD